MTDKELLELAAKAAGYRVKREVPDGGLILWDEQDNCFGWNPLQYDGDALRLAVKLSLTIDIGIDKYTQCDWHNSDVEIEEQFNGDPYAATRRAIVRAAAEIGNEINNGVTQSPCASALAK